MRFAAPPIEFPTIEQTYEPEPSSFEGFIAGMSAKVDELLTAANWQPNFD